MPHTHLLTIGPQTVRKAYVSWADGEPSREWSALCLLSRAAPGLAPEPLARESEEGRPVVVMSRLPGAPVEGSFSRFQVESLAATLRRLFAVPVPDDLPERAFGPSVAVEVVRSWLSPPADLSGCQDPARVGLALAAARKWLDSATPLPIVDPVLAVGDGNVDNLLWDGTSFRMIDFEEFGVSDLAYEVADVVEHASSRLERRLTVDVLLDGLSVDAGRLVEARRLLACFWLGMLLPGNGGFARNPPGSTEDQAAHVLTLLAD